MLASGMADSTRGSRGAGGAVVKSTSQTYGENVVEGGEQRIRLNVRGEVCVLTTCTRPAQTAMQKLRIRLFVG